MWPSPIPRTLSATLTWPAAVPGSHAIAPEDAEERLAEPLGKDAEQRTGQRAYTREVTGAFQPRAVPDQPLLVLAEAGTGIAPWQS